MTATAEHPAPDVLRHLSSFRNLPDDRLNELCLPLVVDHLAGPEDIGAEFGIGVLTAGEKYPSRVATRRLHEAPHRPILQAMCGFHQFGDGLAGFVFEQVLLVAQVFGAKSQRPDL